MRDVLSLILKAWSIATAALVTSALSAFAATNVLTVGEQTGQFATISDAVGAANTDTNLANDYVIIIRGRAGLAPLVRRPRGISPML